HQAEAIKTARAGHNYVLTTGTGSGKSLSYIVPIVDHVLRRGPGKGIQAIVVYPMNALANSQHGELTKFLNVGYPDRKGPVTFARYTGQESEEERRKIMANPPDILLTNYVMLELILTRSQERPLVRQAQDLGFLVFDELHTYRGRQGADVAFLIRRTRDLLAAENLRCVGTSATLAGSGTYDEQRAEISRVASRLFGAEVRPENVIGETLRRATPNEDLEDPSFVSELTARICDEGRRPPADYEDFVADPLSVWIESTFGVTAEEGTGRLVRTTPLSISGRDGAASRLATLTGLPEERCAGAIREGLLAGYECEPDPNTGRKPFAFRLHQFISRGDTVYASFEPEAERYVTLTGQQYVPGDRSRVLMPLAFCRECGQEYHPVRALPNRAGDGLEFRPRTLSDVHDDGESEAGFLFFSTDEPWPDEAEDSFWERLPNDWQEEHRGYPRVRRDRRGQLPRPVSVGADGREDEGGLGGHYLPAPFRFCLSCGISYASTLRSDFTKLASLGSEGRSTATTILSLSAVSGLREAGDLGPEARKILSFTDNRQDASLQAGHFNDFVEIGLLRSALYRAACRGGEEGLAHDELTARVSDALDLPPERYASNPSARFKQLSDTRAALRDVLGYRLYRDLERGWRVTSPNLEQCGLLKISYDSLDDLCAAEDVWEGRHPALAGASPETRSRIAKVLLDDMRRRLAIKVDYLDYDYQERVRRRSNQNLIPPWAVDENEEMKYAAVLFPRPRQRGDVRENAYLSARGGFGQYLRRFSTFGGYRDKLTLEETEEIIRGLLDGLTEAGIVEVVAEPSGEEEVPGYQIQASAMRWYAGSGAEPFHDPIRTPDRPVSDGGTNPFFVGFYSETAAEMQDLEAREHTAQVPYEVREEREESFRAGRLPILYCSPTMELGVDISELNAVNMRNMPPTPANYAQRSGRAGRSGQPTLVFAYCSIGSSHDQYFFKRPERMVAGAVSPPRLDLANEDLVRAHVQALWLTETGQSLGRSLKDVLDVEGEEPSLELKDWVRASFADEGARRRARERAGRVLASVGEDLREAPWYEEGWLDGVLNGVERAFDRSCDRWRTLYRAALAQRATQNRIIGDASRSQRDKDQARRLRREAEAQLELLISEAEGVSFSDFYSYRYFASEGFLPGYSFPRLPISAFVPGSGRRHNREEFLSRPRFLAVSEFGPRASVYHEGARYMINRVILERDEQEVLTSRAKQCETCGYFHPIPGQDDGPDLCENCGAALGAQLRQLFRLQNVSTVRRDRINSDEEERQRLGYELRTGVRFAGRDGDLSVRTAAVKAGERVIATLTYGSAATLWRINLGWTRRKNKDQHGFVLDTERGFWARTEQETTGDPEDPLSKSTQRVIPYVEDTRNCLMLRLEEDQAPEVLASLQSAFKNAIQVAYQLEDNELAAEPLPSRYDRRMLLFYESAEGGAGA
ncbi:MAG: DEAD/DEAH box helicase, partial [Actinomycetota bacterium]|nr:DEAD/DEAH box helicase [Actinomycetota bacterium]